MPKLDPGRLVREAQEVMAASKAICERSRRAVDKSKRLKKIFAATRPESDRARPKPQLKH